MITLTRKLFSILALLSVQNLLATDVNFSLKDARLGTANFANRTVWLQYLSAPSSYGPSTINYSKIITNSDSSGTFSMPTMVPGLWSMAIQAPPDSSTVYFVVLADNLGTINAADYIVLKTSNQYIWANSVSKLTSSNNSVIFYPPSGIGVVDMAVIGGSATNALSVAYKNGALLGSPINSINITNFTVAPAVVGTQLILDLTGGGGAGITNNQFLPGIPSSSNGVFNGSFSGNGAGLTQLPGSSVVGPVGRANDADYVKATTSGGSNSVFMNSSSVTELGYNDAIEQLWFKQPPIGDGSSMTNITGASLVGDLPLNSLTRDGAVPKGTGHLSQFYVTDPSGNPGWSSYSPGAPTFDTVGTGTNISSTMGIGSGSILQPAGSGTIIATFAQSANASTIIGGGTGGHLAQNTIATNALSDGDLVIATGNTFKGTNAAPRAVFATNNAAGQAIQGTVTNGMSSSSIAGGTISGYFTPTAGASNQTTLSLSSPLLMTNPPLFSGYNILYSNRIISATSQEPNPGFQPWNGGDYHGLNIANDPLISITNQQACLGYLYTASDTFMTNKVFNFYDCIFDGKSADSVSLKYVFGQSLVSKSTNTFNFYNCKFIGGHYGVNTVGYRGWMNFYGCTWDIGGRYPRATFDTDDSSIGFLPDQGPVTNYLFGCYIRCRDGYTVNGFLAQTNSYTIMQACTIDVSTTNTTAAGGGNPGAHAYCVQVSGEGGYLLEFDSCHFRAIGGVTNLIIDLTQNGIGNGADATVILNNCIWEGASGPVVVRNDVWTGTRDSLIVSGGNFLPSHFSDPSKVTWLTPQGVGLTNVTTSFTGDGQSVTNIKHSNTFSITSGGTVALTRNGDGSTNFAATITGSQTPWTSDIDGAGFNLSKAGSIGGTNIISGNSAIFTNTASASGFISTGNGPFLSGSNSVAYVVLYTNGSAMYSNVTTGAKIYWDTNFNGYFSNANGVIVLNPGFFTNSGVFQNGGFANFSSTVQVSGNITNTVLTASRPVVTDANKALASGTASGAVPVDADGSATTAAQLQAIAAVVTNDTRQINFTGALNANSLVVSNGFVTTNATLWAVSALSYATNKPTTGNGTLTWDVSKVSNYIETNANITISLTGLPTTNECFSQLTISNSAAAASTILITLNGFCALTNGSTVATSTFYVTNTPAKNQITKISLDCLPTPSRNYTNAIVTHFYDK